MFLLYHAYVYLEFLILACTIYILAPTGQIFDIDNTIRVFSYKSNLWKSTLEKDVPNLATRINAVVNNIGIDKSYFDTFMGNN